MLTAVSKSILSKMDNSDSKRDEPSPPPVRPDMTKVIRPHPRARPLYQCGCGIWIHDGSRVCMFCI